MEHSEMVNIKDNGKGRDFWGLKNRKGKSEVPTSSCERWVAALSFGGRIQDPGPPPEGRKAGPRHLLKAPEGQSEKSLTTINITS